MTTGRHLYDRPVGILVIFTAIMVFGVIGLPHLPIGLFPKGFAANRVWITLRQSTGGTDDTMDRITRPAEAILSGLPGVASISSRTRGNQASIEVEPGEGVDVEGLAGEINETLEAQLHRFPDDLERKTVNTWSADDAPTAVIGLKAAGHDRATLERLTESRIIPALRRIDGVAEADANLEFDVKLRVELEADQLRAGGVRTEGIIDQIVAGTNTSYTYPIRDATGRRQEQVLRLASPHNQAATVAGIPVDGTRSLDQIATILPSDPDAETIHFIDGEPGIYLRIYRSPNANGYRVSQRVEEEVARLSSELGLGYIVPFSVHRQIDQAMSELIKSASWGAAFACLFLLLFLRRFRLTLLICASLPLSIALAVIGMNAAGQDINIPVMIGFLLALGMLVDNSIVVGEALSRSPHAGEAQERSRWLRKATGSVGLAITVSTLTTLAILLPFHLIGRGGFMRVIVLEIGKPIIWSLLGSLVVALILLPIGFALCHRHGFGRRRRYRRGLAERVYGRTLAALLRWPVLGLCLVLGLFAGGVMMLVVNPPAMGGGEQQRQQIYLKICTRKPDRHDLQLAKLQEWFERLRPRYEVLGLTCVSAGINPRWANLDCYLSSIQQTERTPDQIEDDIIAVLDVNEVLVAEKSLQQAQLPPPDNPEGEESGGRRGDRSRSGSGRSGGSDPKGGKGSGKQGAAARPDYTYLRLRLFHPNPELLPVAWRTLRAGLKDLPGVAWPGSEEFPDDDEIELGLTAEAQARGYRVAAVARQVERFGSMRLVGTLQDDTQVQVGPQDREHLRLADLLQTPIYDPVLPPALLTELVTTGAVERPKDIRRRDGRSEFSFSAKIERAQRDAVMQTVTNPAWLASLDLPAGSSVGLGWWETMQLEQQRNNLISLILAAIIVYLLMGIFYESITTPLAAFTAVPLAIFSVVLYHNLMGTKLDDTVFIGMVLLIGIVVNNGIIIVDRMRHVVPPRRLRLCRRHALAIAAAARRRLRPVLLTSLTTVCGALPMALGSSRIADVATGKLGMTVAVGLGGATLFTLFVVPICYQWISRLRLVVTAVFLLAFVGGIALLFRFGVV